MLVRKLRAASAASVVIDVAVGHHTHVVYLQRGVPLDRRRVNQRLAVNARPSGSRRQTEACRIARYELLPQPGTPRSFPRSFLPHASGQPRVGAAVPVSPVPRPAWPCNVLRAISTPHASRRRPVVEHILNAWAPNFSVLRQASWSGCRIPERWSDNILADRPGTSGRMALAR